MQREAVLGVKNGGLHDFLPRSRAVLSNRQMQSRESARHSDRAPREVVAVGDVGLDVFTERIGLEVENRCSFCFRVVIGTLPAPRQTGQAGVDHGGDQGRGDCGIHGIPAAAQHLEPGIGSEGVRRGYHGNAAGRQFARSGFDQGGLHWILPLPERQRGQNHCQRGQRMGHAPTEKRSILSHFFHTPVPRIVCRASR